MKSNYTERAKRFINQFFPYLEKAFATTYDCRRAANAAAYTFNRCFHRNVEVHSGATRIVFVTSDYVVKIDNPQGSCETFGGCEEEYNFYSDACDAGFDYLFAPITPYYHNDFVFWIMPRVHGINRYDETDVWQFLTDEEFDWIYPRIGDIHEGNYGWYHKRPIIIDYACKSFD